MKNKKTVYALILSIVTVVMYCNIIYAAEPVTIKFATYGLLEKSTKPFFEKIVTEFEGLYPDIKVEVLSYPYGDLKQQVLVRCNAGDAPDVVHGETSSFDTYVSSGFLEPLNDLLSRDFVQDIYPAVLPCVSAGDKLYGAPWICSPYVLVYNRELFEEAGLDPNSPPKTFDQLLEYAEKIGRLTDENGNRVYGVGMTTASVPISGDAILSTMFSFGGGVYDAQGKVKANTDGNVKALQFYKTLYEKGLNPEAAKLKDLRNLMAIGRLGMYFDVIWGSAGAYNINPAIRSKLALAPMPATDITDGLSILESHQLHVMKDSKHKKEAIAFVEYVLSKASLVEYSNYLPFLAGQKTINESPELANDYTKPIKDTLYHVKSVGNTHPSMETALLELTTAAQRVTIGGETPEKVAADLDKKLSYILK